MYKCTAKSISKHNVPLAKFYTFLKKKKPLVTLGFFPANSLYFPHLLINKIANYYANKKIIIKKCVITVINPYDCNEEYTLIIKCVHTLSVSHWTVK